MAKKGGKGQYPKGNIPANKIILPKDELIELSKKYGSTTIARYFSVSPQTVRRNMDEYGIEKRGVPKTLPEHWRKALQKPKSVPAWSKGLMKENDERLMRRSESLKGDKNYKWKPELHTGEMVECACGCGETRPKFDKRGRRRHYIAGHSDGGQFKEGHESWNTGKPWDRETVMKMLVRRTPNNEEKFLINFFSEHQLPYKFVGDGKVVIENRNPDFINCNGQKKIIEFFGEHWHVPEDEDIKREIYERYGYEMLVVWGKDIKDHDKLLNMINKFDGGEIE
jgi:very-short-patch-repair endonuclease